jgi:hypothetical protein
MERIIGYKTIIKDGKELQRAIYEDMGVCPRQTTHRNVTRMQGEISYLVNKVENMSSKKSKKYIAKVRKAQKENFGATGKQLSRAMHKARVKKCY